MKIHMKNGFLLPVLIAGFTLITTGRATAQAFTTLHNFTALISYTNSDGANPGGPLILSDGTLYGTADSGGTNGCGTVFSINTNGTDFTALYTFTGGLEGSAPTGPLALSGNTLYGTTHAGGITSGSYGTVFAVNTNGMGFTNLYSFMGGSAGCYPDNGLILSGNTLYGTTPGIYSTGYGTVYAANTSGTNFTTLDSFYEEFPESTLLLSGNTLYGTTSDGGNGVGTVFAVNDTNGTGFTLYSFTGDSDGANPSGQLILSGNTLYGTANRGGTNGYGTVFAVNTSGSNFAVLHTFTALVSETNYDGTGPNSLILSGNTLYGTAGGGGSSGWGTVFTINTNGTGFIVLHNFTALSAPSYDGGTNSDGTGPYGLIMSGNTLYGAASGGGNSGNGTVFSISLALVVTTTSLPNGTEDMAYSQTLTAIGGQTPYSWTNSSGTLPTGLHLSTNGMISGTPTTNGTFTFTVVVTDANNNIATQALSLTVLPPNLVLNSGFETGDFTDWTLSGDTSYTFVDNGSLSGIKPYSGSYEAALGTTSSLGYLSQTLPTTAGSSYLLSFWMDNPYGDPSEFIVSWNGNTLLDETNPVANDWINIQFVVSATGTSTVLQFGFQDDNNYLGLDDISVLASQGSVSAPVFQTVKLDNGQFMLTWSTVSNGVYQLQYKTNLTQANWINIGSTNIASSTVLSVTNAIGTDQQRFYRVQQQ